MQKVDYRDYNDGLGRSAEMWADCPIADIMVDSNVGVFIEDDFLNFSQHISDQDTQQYASYIDTGVTIKQLATAANFGQIEIAGNDADNDEGVLATHGPIGTISDTAASAYKLWFETRVAKASITDEYLGMFVGLGFDDGNAVPLSKTICLTDDEAELGAFSYIGFHVDLSDADALDFTYKAAGQTAVVTLAAAQTMAASTFYKVGFKYDPDAEAAKRIKIYVDGVEQTTYVTATNIAAATFPDAEELGFVWATKVGEASEVKAQMDWWSFAQLRTT